MYLSYKWMFSALLYEISSKMKKTFRSLFIIYLTCGLIEILEACGGKRKSSQNLVGKSKAWLNCYKNYTHSLKQINWAEMTSWQKYYPGRNTNRGEIVGRNWETACPAEFLTFQNWLIGNKNSFKNFCSLVCLKWISLHHWTLLKCKKTSYFFQWN